MNLPRLRIPRLKFGWLNWQPISRDRFFGRIRNGAMRLLGNRSNIALLILGAIIITSGLVWANQQRQHSAFRVSIPSLQNSNKLPVQFTCDGSNINPAIEFNDLPNNTRGLAIIIEDLDLDKQILKETPYYAHWMVWNIPPEITKVNEGIRPPGIVGRNLFGNIAYSGPCPPIGEKHNYILKLIALDTLLTNLDSDATFDQVKQKINRSRLDQAEMIFSYQRAAKQ